MFILWDGIWIIVWHCSFKNIFFLTIILNGAMFSPFDWRWSKHLQEFGWRWSKHLQEYWRKFCFKPIILFCPLFRTLQWTYNKFLPFNSSLRQVIEKFEINSATLKPSNFHFSEVIMGAFGRSIFLVVSSPQYSWIETQVHLKIQNKPTIPSSLTNPNGFLVSLQRVYM